MRRRLLAFIGSPELGLVSTLFFAGLYTWPFLTSRSPGGTVRFIFLAWCVHIALIAAASFGRERSEMTESAAEAGDDAVR